MYSMFHHGEEVMHLFPKSVSQDICKTQLGEPCSEIAVSYSYSKNIAEKCLLNDKLLKAEITVLS